MSLRLIILSLAIFLTLVAVATAEEIEFDESNPIRMVSDDLREVENTVVKILGQSRHVLSFSRRYKKMYQSVEEVKLLFSVFMENLDLIRTTNKKGLPYELSLNQFADLTRNEFQRHNIGAAQNCSAILKGTHKLTKAALPETMSISFLFLTFIALMKKDWRDDGIVTPVKEQGHCGSCWTFSTTGALEAPYHQAFGKGISLSEQQVVDCAGTFNKFGCHGGIRSQAFEYIKYNGGIDKEDAYPYIGKDGGCKFSAENIGVQVLDSVNITQVQKIIRSTPLVSRLWRT